MLTAKEEKEKPNTKVIKFLYIQKSAKGNAESEELPSYLRSEYASTY